MKKVVLFSLLFSVVAVSAASARVFPLPNTQYKCFYVNQTMGEDDPGFSYFEWVYMNTATQKRGIEYYDVTSGPNPENRKVTFAKPVDGGPPYNPHTTWEFTINPSGPQCKETIVRYNGSWIDFFDCTDGHSRTCLTSW